MSEIIEQSKGLWKSALENAKLIASTILVLVSLIVGAWTGITSVFITRAEAQVAYEKLDVDTSYNKAFRIESKISALEDIANRRELSKDEIKILDRLKRDLQRVDDHIDKVEKRLYDDN